MNQTPEAFLSRSVGATADDRLVASRFGGTIGIVWELVTRWDIVVAATLMALVSFSLPGREGPDGASGLDSIALIKLAIRLSVVAWFGLLLLVHCIYSLNQRARQLHRPAWTLVGEFIWSGSWTDKLLLPWWCFAAWSLVTVIWSPRFSVSLGQWLGLVGILAFAQVISNRYATSKSFPWQPFAKQLNAVFVIYSFMVLVAHIVAPGASGLNRDLSVDVGSNGLFHPTAVGATSSLGLTLVGVLFLRNVVTKVSIVLSMMTLHIVVLYLSASRAALAMACLAGLICFVCLMPRLMRGAFLSLVGVGLLLMVILDPGFESAGSAIRDASSYVQRGQSIDQLRQVSGRAELWTLIWEQFKGSPIIGHGYFVTSSTGKLDVWGGTSSEDAHNALLQVLVSTGIVGGLIFLWALLVSVGHLASSLVAILRVRVSERNSSDLISAAAPIFTKQRVEVDFVLFVVVVATWYLGWSQACVSFLGPIRPEVVAFFGILGLLSAHARWVSNRAQDEECALS